MVIVIKKNKQLQVADEKLAEFIEMGYSQIDENGKVIQQGKANTIAAYETENNLLKVENTKLKKEIEKLKAENEQLKAINLEKDVEQEKKKGKV